MRLVIIQHPVIKVFYILPSREKMAENGRMSVAEDEECKITLNEGDMIHVVSADPQDAACGDLA